MKEININIEGYNVNGICVGCLNYNRRMFYDNDAKEVFKLIGQIDVPDGLSVQVCWECLAAVKSVIRFQKQILNSFEALISYSNENTFLNSPKDFTQHASTRFALTDKTEHLDIIPKPNVGDNSKDDDKVDTDQVKEEDVFLELDPTSIKQEDYDDPYTSDINLEPIQQDSTDEDIQLSQLKDKENTQSKKKKKEKKKKKKLKEPPPEEPPKGRRLKNLPPDIIQLYTMSEEEMHTVRATDIQSEAFTKLKYRCDDCIIGFNTEKLKEYHMNGKHKPKSKNCHQCDVCKAYFLTKENLSTHRALHLAAYRCTMCRHVTTLKRGVATHACAKPYLQEHFQCTDCDMVFSDSDQTGSENTESDNSERESDIERNDESGMERNDESGIERNDESGCTRLESNKRNTNGDESDHFQDESENESVSSESAISIINETLATDNNYNQNEHNDPLNNENNTKNAKSKTLTVNLESESEIEESFSIESRGVTRKTSKNKRTKSRNDNTTKNPAIQNPEPPIQQMSSLQLSNSTTAQPHNNCENCPKIDKLISLAETLHSNQKTLFNTINDLENRVLKRLDHISSKFDEFVQKNVSKALKPEPKFKIIANKAQLDKFESDLDDLNFKNDLKNHFSVLCSKGKGRAGHNAYLLIDALFSRKFLTECSWAGGSRSDMAKIPFRQYKNILRFFFEIVYESDNTYNLHDSQHFFKTILKNSFQRVKGTMRQSTPKNRRKTHEILLERQLDPEAEASTQQLLGLMQAITNFENNQQEEEITDN